MRTSTALYLLFTLLFAPYGNSSELNSNEPISQKPDYNKDITWYTNIEKNHRKSVDVFYILPTCVFNWTDSEGVTYQYGDVYNTEQRAAQLYSCELAEEIFGDVANFYAPYYRQLTLNVWMSGEQQVERLFPAAMADINDAFDNFIETKNNNRPFILAGFSQGGKAVVELVKGLNSSEMQRMVAAYVIGYRVTSCDMQSPNIVAATGADDTGVTICYNSVAKVEAINPMISASEFCINPVNWRVDETIAQISEGIRVRVDKVHKVLLVEGLDSEALYTPNLGELFCVGNYHLQELELYKEYIKENVKTRFNRVTTTK